MNAELIGLILLIFTTLGNFYKSHSDKKASLKKLIDRDKILTESLKELKEEVSDTKKEVQGTTKAVKELKNETDFERILKNTIRSKANQIVNNSYQHNSHKNILMYISGQIEDFALLFYYSPFRNKPKEQEKYLQVHLAEKRMHVNTFINSASCEIKMLKGKKYSLNDFLKEMNIYRHVELLALDLKRNGLSKDDIINRFTEFTDTLLDEVIKAFIIYKGLDDLEK